MASSSKEVMTLKLLIDKKKNKVLFAEAGKDFVDFLFTLLSLPVSTVVRLLTAKNMVGSLGNLYESVENLSDTYIQPKSKEVLLKPKVAVGSTEASFLLTSDDVPAQPAITKIYECSSCSSRYVTNDPKNTCPSCKSLMTYELTFVPPKVADVGVSGGGEGGYVKGVVTYMVMDDLAVMPMSTISGIALLSSKWNVTDVASLEEKVVTFGMDEGLKLLKLLCIQNIVLTSVFLGGMGTTDASSSNPSDHATIGETGPIAEALASNSKANSEPSTNEAVASPKPESKEFNKRFEECFNIIIKEQKSIRKRVDYCVKKLEERLGAPYFPKGEEQDPTDVPEAEINIS